MSPGRACQLQKCPSFLNARSRAAGAGFLNFVGFPHWDETPLNVGFFGFFFNVLFSLSFCARVLSVLPLRCKSLILSIISKLEGNIGKKYLLRQDSCAESSLYAIWITLTTNTINSAMILSEDELAC